MFFCIFFGTLLFKLRLQFTMAVYDLEDENKKNKSHPSWATARVAPTIHELARPIRRIVGATLAVNTFQISTRRRNSWEKREGVGAPFMAPCGRDRLPNRAQFM